jgi:hypothetical protein
MKDNQHVQAIPSTVMTQVQTKIDGAKALITPYLLALTPAERQGLPKFRNRILELKTPTMGFRTSILELKAWKSEL